jgi:hypothetical protein
VCQCPDLSTCDPHHLLFLIAEPQLESKEQGKEQETSPDYSKLEEAMSASAVSSLSVLESAAVEHRLGVTDVYLTCLAVTDV